MAYTKYSFAGGHVLVSVFAVIVALACGVMIGYLIPRPAGPGGVVPLSGRRPSAQAVIAFLSKPLPVPEGAKLLPLPGGSGRGSVHNGRGGLNTRILLDVTDMAPEDVEAIPDEYESLFHIAFNMGGHSMGMVMELVKHPPDQFSMFHGVGTWHRKDWSGDSRGHFDLELETQIMDFDPNVQNKMRFIPLEVEHYRSPVRGQRVMLIRLCFKARDLEGDEHWPKPR